MNNFPVTLLEILQLNFFKLARLLFVAPASQAPLTPVIHPTLYLLMATSTNATYSVNISMTALGTVTSDGSGLVPLDTSPVVFIFKVTNLENKQAYILVQASEITIVDSIIVVVLHYHEK